MKIDVESLKIEVIDQAISTTEGASRVISYYLPRTLHTTKFSKHWDLNFVVPTIRKNGEVVFMVRGKEFKSEFLGERWILGINISHPTWEDLDVHVVVKKGYVLGAAAQPFCDYVNTRADFSAYLKAHKAVLARM